MRGSRSPDTARHPGTASKVLRVAIAMLLCVVLAAAAVRLLAPSPPGAAATGFRSETLGHLARRDAVAEDGRIVFLGSSTFHALDDASISPLALNLGLGGDTTRGLIGRLPGYRSARHARAIVVNIGLNELMRGDTAEDLPYDDLLSQLDPARPLVILGLQQVRREDPARQQEIRTQISTANERLRRLCVTRPVCRFVPNPVDETPEGLRLLGEDGIHLSRDGYAELRPRLRAALSTLPGLEPLK